MFKSRTDRERETVRERTHVSLVYFPFGYNSQGWTMLTAGARNLPRPGWGCSRSSDTFIIICCLQANQRKARQDVDIGLDPKNTATDVSFTQVSTWETGVQTPEPSAQSWIWSAVAGTGCQHGMPAWQVAAKMVAPPSTINQTEKLFFCYNDNTSYNQKYMQIPIR